MTHLYRTQTTGNRRTFTVSTWIKFSGSYGSSGAIILNTDGSNTNQNFMFQLKTDNTISLHLYGGDVFTTSRKLRDYSGWYHIVLGIDTTQASAGDRVKLYVNGELQSITQESLYPAQNFDFGVGDNGRIMSIMGDHDNSNNYDNRSYISHYHFCDGYQYQASDFGSTDATTGEWKINTSPSVNYGSTGFFLKFENSGNLTLDSGGNNISFSTSGTPIASQDNPSNVFATIDLLSTHASNYTFANGNNKVTNSNPSTRIIRSTLGASSGKYYFETKIATVGGSGGFGTGLYVGVTDADYFEQLGLSQAFIGTGSNQVAQRGDGSHLAKNNTQINGYESCSAGSILQVALDLDNGYVYFGVNGTWGNSGDPTSGATGTGGVSITTGKTYMFAASGYNGWSVETNFGNGYFGTTAVSSAGTNASNIGIFEYDVPSGYTALSTKGLNE